MTRTRASAKTPGIRTKLFGIEFRSRVEARWAAFFTEIGWPWNYEPFDANGYIPDFVISGELPLLVEVKAATTLAEYQAPVTKAVTALKGLWDHDILIVGASPRPMLPDACGEAAGWMGQFWEYDVPPRGGDSWAFANGLWHRCLECGAVAVHHSEQSFAGRPCDHYDGDGYLGELHAWEIDVAWGKACNATKWLGT